MPARNRPGLSERTRQRIKTTMIVKRLEDHIDDKVEMTSTQVSAALGLLRKTLPDLQVVNMDVTTAGESLNQESTRTLLHKADELSRKARVSHNHLDS